MPERKDVTTVERLPLARRKPAHPAAGGLWLARPGARGLPATRWVETRLP